MKNLTMKKIALGIFLAGYAASGAFAATTSATTKNTIMGHAPMVNAEGVTSLEKHSLDVVIYRGATALTADQSVQAGDVITVTWKINDYDGDLDTTKRTAATISFTYKDDTGTWAAYSNAAAVAGNTPVAPTGYDRVQWTIPNTAAGATAIGFVVQPTTQFGAPDHNDWLGINDITSSTAPGNGGSGDKPGSENIPEGGPGEDGKKPTGPSTDKPIVPNVDGLRVQIVLNTDATKIYGDSDAQGTVVDDNPKVGETFTYIVKDTANNDKVVTNLYNATWSYSGDDSLAGATSPVTADATATEVSATYKIDVNSADLISNKFAPTKPVAGAQGYKLVVNVSPK